MRAAMAALNDAIAAVKLDLADGVFDLSQPVLVIGQQHILPQSRSLYRCFTTRSYSETQDLSILQMGVGERGW